MIPEAYSEQYSEPYQRPNMECFAKIVNKKKLLTIFLKMLRVLNTLLNPEILKISKLRTLVQKKV